jgi:DNA (cytosine-5)-methyltransferase 1
MAENPLKKLAITKKKGISIGNNTGASINLDSDENNHRMQPTFIEVCAGAGGMSSGLIKAGFQPLLLNDIDKNCCKTLEKNHPGCKIVCDSLLNLDLKEYKGNVDLLANGSPCQSFSLSGERKGTDDPRGELMPKFVELIEAVEPKIFLIENVKGLLIHDDGNTLEKIISTLNRKNKYNVVYKLLNAMNYNVPQKRERVFIIGTLKSANINFEYPTPEAGIITLGQALAGVPSSEGAVYSEKKREYFNLIPEGGCWVNLPEDKQKEYLMSSFESGGGKRGILRRLSRQEPSLTLLCTPSQKQTERCHPTETRPLQIREYARIQTFPDNYEFIGSLASKYKQIGNAVPVELAFSVGKSLKNALH